MTHITFAIDIWRFTSHELCIYQYFLAFLNHITRIELFNSIAHVYFLLIFDY